jgi:hypothetical protein
MEPCKPAGLISKKIWSYASLHEGICKKYGAMQTSGTDFKKIWSYASLHGQIWKKLAQPNSSYSNKRRQYHMGTIIATWVRSLS